MAVAIFMQVHYYGEHQLFWAFICLALAANLFALVGYVARNVDSIEDRDGELIPSDLQLKFKQRPEECVLVLMLGIVSTESLCFLSKEQHDHKNFRSPARRNQCHGGQRPSPTASPQFARPASPEGPGLHPGGGARRAHPPRGAAPAAEQPREAPRRPASELASRCGVCPVEATRRAEQTLTSSRRVEAVPVSCLPHVPPGMLGLLSNVIEGIPMLALQIVFLYRYGWVDGKLVAVGLIWGVCTLVVRAAPRTPRSRLPPLSDPPLAFCLRAGLPPSAPPASPTPPRPPRRRSRASLRSSSCCAAG